MSTKEKQKQIAQIKQEALRKQKEVKERLQTVLKTFRKDIDQKRISAVRDNLLS